MKIEAQVIEVEGADEADVFARAALALGQILAGGGPLTQAVEGYLGFLIDSPAFLRLVLREELSGASVLREVPRSSRAIEDAVEAVRGHAGSRGIGSFDTTDVVLLFVSLTFFPAAQGSTLMTTLGRDLSDGATRERHVRFVVDQLIALIGE